MSNMSDDYGSGPCGLTPDDVKKSRAIVESTKTFDIKDAPEGIEFLAEDRNGDWIRVGRYKNPFGFENSVINNRTGKWWSPTRWMPIPSAPTA